MNLKIAVELYQNGVLFRGSEIASAAVAASSAIASAGIDRVARAIGGNRTIRGKMTPAEPGRAPAIADGVIAAIVGVVAGLSAITLAVSRARHQRVADQGRAADRDSECRHRACHGSVPR
jgi:hypothetical protein